MDVSKRVMTRLVGLQTVVQKAVFETRAGSPQGAFQLHLSAGQVRGELEMLRLVSEIQATWQVVRFGVAGADLEE